MGCRGSASRAGELRAVPVLADNDRHRRRRDDARLGDDHGEVLHRRHVVHQVEQLEPRPLAPVGERGAALVGVRRLEQRVGVAELVVADRVEQDPLRKLVRLAADEHGDPVLVRRHGDERGAGARDEGAVDQHRRGPEQNLGDGWHRVREGVQQRVGAADACRHQPHQHRAPLEARAAVDDDDGEVGPARRRVQQRRLDDVGAAVDEDDVRRRDLGRGGLRDGAVGELDPLVDVRVDLRAEDALGRVGRQVRGQLANAELEPLDRVAHRERLRAAVVQVRDLQLDPPLELAGECLAGRAAEVARDGLQCTEHGHHARVGAGEEALGHLQPGALDGGVDVAPNRGGRERCLALVLDQVREERHLLRCKRRLRLVHAARL
mmetsp:Transcript_45735/g.151659  ORF Transcript_45735/g.151659 Transcript_45735/m.151659 type:complete len:378 (+) Transcript_45735:185-1318(+)